ncbi:MAG: InlB B-repeat-containing protein [Aristaeellaceae bacterium]
MKKLSRLTALLLTLAMLVTSMPLMALANTITVDIDTWNSWVEEAQNAAANQTQTVTNTVTVTGETSVVDRPVVEVALTAHEGVQTSATQAAGLPIAGKLVLKAYDKASSYQWQVKAGSQWANIVGDKGASTTLTYAKIQNAISGGVAQVRCVMVVDGQDYVSATAQVTVDSNVTYTTVETESTLTVTAKVPVSGNYVQQSGGSTTYVSASNEGITKYTIVINFLFEDNTVAADPYKAELAEGSNFTLNYTFPVVQGYLPYLNDEQENSISETFTNIQADITYNIVYKPTLVNYTVIHYQQNVNDDNYTEVERETQQGLTKDTVPEVAKTYAGFYALLYEQPAIAADGSTVVEVYYDRYYYLMNFDLDGGYGVEPIYARYGAAIGDVGTPKKAGYAFGGWTLNGTSVAALPETMPAENRTYKASWIVNDAATVTVVFWGENADDEEYSYIKSAQVQVAPGTEFTYSEDGTLICALEEHSHSLDQNCYALTCTQEEHTHSDSCSNCGQKEHTTHTTDCYENVGTRYSGRPTSAPRNPSEGEVYQRFSWSQKYIYINGNWYEYNGTTSDGEIAPTKCAGLHTHSDACYDHPEHTHSIENGCYALTCTKTEHSHTSECYMSGAGLDSNLWEFVKSDTVTVAADGSSVVNVYYDRTTFTLTFKDDDVQGSDKTVYTLTEKWGADISEHWPIEGTNGKTYNSGERWNPSGSNTYSKVLVYIAIMPDESFTLKVDTNSFDPYTMHYMVETLPDESGTNYGGKVFKQAFEISAKYNYVTKAEDFFDLDGFTQWASDPAFEDGKIENGDYGCDVYFYYTRNAYDIEFYNPTSLIKKEEDVPYQSPLGPYDFEPGEKWIPGIYEPGSVYFAGWYLNPECTGEQYILSSHTMPAGPEKNDTALSLYAKWLPKSRTVEFYLDQNAWEAGTKLATHPDITVPHGTVIGDVADPENGAYTFVGWFYMEDGVEKAFDFTNMPVNKNLQVYGKWSSNVLKQYTVYYKVQGTDIQIAAPTTGSGLAGATKTFDAKGGTDLYAAYQEGYFPVTRSHSLTLDIADDSKNIYTFEYVQAPAVPYTVYYVTTEPDAEGYKIMLGGVEYTMVAETKTVDDNRKAVVTETFAPVSGYLPDAYQKRLVVSVDENGDPDTAHNVIIFYYTKDTTHAYYKITHYTENLGTDAAGNPTWTEYASSQAVGEINERYTASDMSIPGFTFDPKVEGTVTEGVLTAGGLELKLYYTRNSYPYQVRYLEQGTGKQLAEPKNGTGKYGQVIAEVAADIANYTVVAPASQTLNIRIEEDTTAKLNIITFYYTENEATITYQVVGPTGCGTVSTESETVKVLTGAAQGSAATANTNFKFVGWYADEACTQLVSTDATYVPAQPSHTENGQTVMDPWASITYYAKFEVDKADLTIRKNGMDSGESAIFNVSGPGYNGQVVVPTGGSVTLFVTCGEYTITEVGDWSNRYTWSSEGLSDGKVTLTANGADVTFTNAKKNDKWLYDESSIVNFNKTGSSD